MRPRAETFFAFAEAEVIRGSANPDWRQIRGRTNRTMKRKARFFAIAIPLIALGQLHPTIRRDRIAAKSGLQPPDLEGRCGIGLLESRRRIADDEPGSQATAGQAQEHGSKSEPRMNADEHGRNHRSERRR